MRISDWSSDVCSSDLVASPAEADRSGGPGARAEGGDDPHRPGARRRAGKRSVAPVQAGAGQWRRQARRNPPAPRAQVPARSEEHTSELQSLMRISYAVFCLKTKKNQ